MVQAPHPRLAIENKDCQLRGEAADFGQTKLEFVRQ